MLSPSERLAAGIYAGLHAVCRPSMMATIQGGRPVIFAWHDVRPDERGLFRRQIAWLLEHRRVVWSCDISPYSGGCIALTFDDGLDRISRTITPVLESLDAAATSFVPTGLLGQPRHLSRESVVDVAKSGHIRFGAHTRSHMRLSGLVAEQLDGEVRGSR